MTNEELVFEIQNDKFAKGNMQILYDRNLPLIKKYIKKYTMCVSEDEEQDLLQEAYFGLWETVRRYEASEKVLFMTYAKWWIMQYVRRYLNNNCSLIRTPANITMKIYQYNKMCGLFYKENGRYPTTAEVAEYMHISIDSVRKIEKYKFKCSSTDSFIDVDEEITVCELIKDDFELETNVIDIVYDEYQKNEIWGILERNLDSRETGVLVDHYKNNMTLQAIADKNNISKSRVRQIENKGLQKLRMGKLRRKLLEKFEIYECSKFNTGLNDFKRTCTSSVERVAIKKIEAESEYKEKLLKMFGLNKEFLPYYI